MSGPAITKRPILKLITDDMVLNVIGTAKEILEKTGIRVYANDGLELLGSAGARIDRQENRVFIPLNLVEGALESVPRSVKLYDRNGREKVDLGSDDVYFQTTSSNIRIWDSEIGKIREPLLQDLLDFIRVADALENISILSTTFYPVDIPSDIASLYRTFMCLRTSSKPLHASAIPTPRKNTDTLIELAAAIRGGKEKLKQKPLIVSPVTIVSPLTWLADSYYALSQFALHGIPSWVSMAPAMGVSAPVSIIDAVTQQVAEMLSAVVISQLTNPGTPVVAANYIEFFDMRLGTTCMGTMENYMADMACAQVLNHIQVPCHVYMGCSDAKRPDYQAGLESGIGLILGALCGANVVQSPGGLSDVIPLSFEKLVIDNETCGMAYRLRQGITPRGERLAEDLFSQGVFNGDHFLSLPNTIKWFKQEACYPGRTFNRDSIETWQDAGSTTAEQRAKEEVARILATHRPEPLDPEIDKALVEIMSDYARFFGVDRLPMLNN